MSFLSLLCNLYIIGLTVALPLYTGGSYWQLGDTKYLLFRNISLFCLGIWCILSLLQSIGRAVLRGCHKGGALLSDSGPQKMSVTDCFVLGYGAAVLLSAFFSAYETTAWNGYREWYMGALSQLMFVGIYFFVSRCFDGSSYPIRLWEAAFFLITLLGCGHRLGLDPLGIMAKFNSGDWEYSHMLSTIGNINWFCGYCSVALVFPVTGYLKSVRRRTKLLLYAVSVLGLALLVVQGSDMGVVLAALCLFVCLLWGIRDNTAFRRTLILAAGAFFLLPIYGWIAGLLGESALKALPADSLGWNVLQRWSWWILGAMSIGLYIVLRRFAENKDLERKISLVVIILIALTGISGVLIYSIQTPFNANWGSGRGGIWLVALQGFGQSGPLQKLVGVGPDCFAEYIYSTFSRGAVPSLEGRWADAVYANAHNEWLNHLVNLGIMGTGCYMGIFISGVRRYRRYLPAILAILLYGAASLTGFQQVLCTPQFFLVLGIAENRIVCKKSGDITEVSAKSEDFLKLHRERQELI